VRRELFGRSWTIEGNEDGRVELAFPPLIKDGEMFLSAPGWPDDPVGLPTIGTTEDPEQIVSVKAVRTTVDLDADLSEWEPAHLGLYARDLAREAVDRLTAWARILHDQAWLGLSSEHPPQIWVQELLDAETGEPISGTVRELVGIRLLSEEDALDEGAMESIIDRTRRRDPIPIAEALLRDAEYLAWHIHPSDFVRAVLLAAIACEAKIKGTLRKLAPTGTRDLVDLVIDNPREVTLQAASLFDRSTRATVGRSLKDEQPALYKRITRLFELRNGIAHREEFPDETEAGDVVRAAREAFGWLEGIASGDR
jgi:hypothetical protein